MKVIYGIDPDFYINNPEALAYCNKDVILPKYFYIQLTHLSKSNYPVVTDAAKMILNSLTQQVESDDLFFKTVCNGNIHFIDESLYHSKNKDYPINNETLLDCYLLSLLEISEILEAKIIFITSSPEVIKKCRLLNFEIGTLEDSSNGECWLEPKMRLDAQASSSFDNFRGTPRIRVSPRNPDSDPLDLSKLTTWTTSVSNAASEIEPIAVDEQVNTSEPENLKVIQWQDIAVMEQPSGIQWIDIAPR